MHVRPHADGWCVFREHSNSAAKVYWSRRFAIDAGRELAKSDPTDLLVHDDRDEIDFRVSYSRTPTGVQRLSRRRRSASADSVRDLDELGRSTSTLLEILLPYDAWCLRAARCQSAQALAGQCPHELLDELLLVITELVLQVTVRTRCACTLLLQRTGDEILIAVGEPASPRDGGAVGQPSVSARCNVASRASDDG